MKNGYWNFYKVMSIAVLVSGSSGCVSFRIQEDNWFRPEALVLEQNQLSALALPANYKAESFSFSAKDGTSLAALHVYGVSDSPTIFYLGGDSFKIAKQGLEIVPVLTGFGFNVFMIDYRGYGGSEGSPSIDTMMSDAEDALDILRNRLGAGYHPVVVHGFSLGSFIGAELAVRRKVEGLILESTATTVREWADYQVPWYGKPFVRINIAEKLASQSNLVRVKHYSGPLLIIAGAKDKKTPLAMSRELIKASSSAPTCRQLVKVKEAGHGDALIFDIARAAYKGFVDNMVVQCGRSRTENLAAERGIVSGGER